MGSRKNAPRKIAPWRIAPGKLPPKKIVPHKIAPWKNALQEKCSPENCPPWNFFVNFFLSLIFTFMRIFVWKWKMKILLLLNSFFYYKWQSVYPIFFHFFLVRLFLIFRHSIQCLSYIYAWPTILGIVTWLVRRIGEKLPSRYGSAIICPYKSNSWKLSRNS